ncbi:MAG: glycoside hydrolase family 127 protein [Pirellulaceae bacterium]
MYRSLLLPLLLVLPWNQWPGTGRAAEPVPGAYQVEAKIPDVLHELSPADVQLRGWLGQRVAANEANRLAQVDLEPLLAGYRQKPGTHPWIGEHIGKWMHAATLAWVYTRHEALRKKLDYAAEALIKAQEDDGYLGTYTPDKRFGLYPQADWDVWSHKYCLMGLLTYYRFTGHLPALDACRKIGDLLIQTFGTGPGKKSIIDAGTHVGMAATSVLEPVVLLYRHTGDQRYLEFAQYLVQAWNEPNGPRIIATLLEKRQVHVTANAKAYEMLSNLVGLCELARASGNRELLESVRIAWQDIVAHRLYLTGSASQHERFGDDHYLPNDVAARQAETCVTTTWIQLNSQLLRLTGESCFGAELERTFFNHLAAAQRPDGAEWCYYTALEGTKPYGPGINCCVSSGPRGMALVPQQAYLKKAAAGEAADLLVVNLFEPSQVTLTLDNRPVTVEQQTDFPRAGGAAFLFHLDRPARFGLQIRVPAWAGQLELDGAPVTDDRIQDGWLTVAARDWQEGDRLELAFALTARMVLGEHGNTGRAALLWGPFVLAYDQQKDPMREAPPLLGIVAENQAAPVTLVTAAEGALTFSAKVRSARHPAPRDVVLVPFADAGAGGGRFQVWLSAPGTDLPVNDAISAYARESRSREGNVHGSITDGDLTTFVVTFSRGRQEEDWYAVTLDALERVQRIVFAHGKTFHDGGWFDTSAGKPRIEVQREHEGPWEMVAELSAYPATTSTDSAGLQDGQAFTQRLPHAVRGLAWRVVGVPACGDSARQAFSSCAELQVFEE